MKNIRTGMVALAALALAACGPKTPPPDYTRPAAILLITGQTEGRLEPCGCSTHPAGGMARRETLAQRLRQENPGVPVAFLETGSFLSHHNPAGTVYDTALIEWMNAAPYLAAGVGDTDLADGGAALASARGQAKFRVISANASQGGRPCAEPEAVLAVTDTGDHAGDLRIGVTAVTGLAHAPKHVPPASVSLAEPLENGLAERVASLRERADLVFVLAVAPMDELQAIAKNAGDVDLYAFSCGSQTTTQPQRLDQGGQLIITGDLGRRLFEVRVFRSADGARPRLEIIPHHLTAAYADDPATLEKARAAIARANEVNKQAAARMAAPPPGPGDRRYAGGATCAECHADAHKAQLASKHENAFHILEVKNQQYNPECVPCHTTGFGRPGGFVNADATPELKNVQCEQCHGPAEGHPDRWERFAEDPARGKQSLCITCHTPADSPEFTFAHYWESIAHK